MLSISSKKIGGEISVIAPKIRAVWYLLAIILIGARASAWTFAEHVNLADSALSAIVHECPTCATILREIGSLGQSPPSDRDTSTSDTTFGRITGKFAKDQFARGRFHVRGATTLVELRFIPEEILRQVFLDVEELEFDSKYSRRLLSTAKARADNVVANYLINHLIALVKARSGNRKSAVVSEGIKQALLWEAVAQGYLADAFSSSHMVVPVHTQLSFLTGRNNKEASRAFANRGWYMMNSRGDVWQGFGERLLDWYLPTYEPVLEACQTSLRELFVAYLTQKGEPWPPAFTQWVRTTHVEQLEPVSNGHWKTLTRAEGYLDPAKDEIALPTLRLIPMPITATWSEHQTDSSVYYRGKRKHFPQLAEDNLHDSSLCYLDEIALYHKRDVPIWMIPEPLRRPSPEPADSLVKFELYWASVQYLQDFKMPLAPRGLQIHLSEQSNFSHGSGTYLRFGVGYGLHAPRFALVDPLSIQTEFIPGILAHDRSLYAVNAGLGVVNILKGRSRLLPGFVRIDVGYSFGTDGNTRVSGFMIGPAIDYDLTTFGSFNAGLRLRIGYRWYCLKPTIGGITVGIVLM
jgi:hypothetical protein